MISRLTARPMAITVADLKGVSRPKVLGLDLGTNCGYCFVDQDNLFSMGLLDLSAGSYDSGAIRFLRLRRFLEELNPESVYYEDVKFTPSVSGPIHAIMARAATSCEFFGGLKATVAVWAEANGIPCQGIPIGSIKKRACGKGNVGKPEMILACNKLFSVSLDAEGFASSGDDNIADAAFICLMGYESHGRDSQPVSSGGGNKVVG